MKETEKTLELLQQADTRLVKAASSVKVLSSVAWSAEVMQDFMLNWRRKSRHLPIVEQRKYASQQVIDELNSVMSMTNFDHPIAKLLHATAASYRDAAVMLQNCGHPTFLELSRQIYGDHDSPVVSGGVLNYQLAEDFISLTGDLHNSLPDKADDHCLTPFHVADVLKKEADKFFGAGKIDVVIDNHLAAKAAAGAQRVRIRGETPFAQHDVDQLLQHELFVHTATTINGRLQPRLKSLGLGSPRTTCTQEGLATFAELITASMDLSRLRRLALRIKGVGLAAGGADFIDVFEFFLNSGQSEEESFQSAARIFRGGKVSGGVYFTKDIVYLKGLFSVHTFLRKAIEARKVEYPLYLFIGRVTLGDVLHLEPWIQSGFLTQPTYMPEWVVNRNRLAAYLSYALLANKLNLSQIKLHDFGENVMPEDQEVNSSPRLSV